MHFTNSKLANSTVTVLTLNTQYKLYDNHCKTSLLCLNGTKGQEQEEPCHSHLLLLRGQRQLYSHCISTVLDYFFFSCGVSMMPTSRASEKITDIMFTSPDLTRRQSLVISPCQWRRGRRQASKQNVRDAVGATQRNFLLVLSCVVRGRQVWDAVESGRCLRVYTCHRGAVRDACWTPCGRRLLTGAFDDQCAVTDVETGE